MSEFKPYVAVQEFVVNLDGGKRELRAKYGDLLEFDGLNIKSNNVEGEARSFSSAIRAGEWVKAVSAEKLEAFKQSASAKAAAAVQSVDEGPVRARNETGGKIVEGSDVGASKVSRKSPDKDLQDLVNNYEDETYPTEEEEAELIAKRKIAAKKEVVEESLPKKSKVINYDEDIVAKVSEAAHTDAETKNTSGVELEEQTETDSVVVSEEEQVVKPTNYAEKESSDGTRKKLTVAKDSEGVVVRKTSVPAISRTEINEHTKVAEDSLKVLSEDVVVSETNYEESKSIDVGSSTKAGVVASRKATTKVVKRATSTGSDDQGAVVVGKVSASREASLVDGIIVKTTVGSNEESEGKVVISSGGTDIENVEATFSGSDSSIVDLSDFDESTDIDINDLLE
jgi:hypothetical protein